MQLQSLLTQLLLMSTPFFMVLMMSFAGCIALMFRVEILERRVRRLLAAEK